MENRYLGIYVIFDRDGIVDDYVKYFIEELKKQVEHLVIVCNGAMKSEAIEVLHTYTDSVYVRDNSGYDAAAYKEALEIFYGFDKVMEFNGLILANDSFYGPFCPLEQIVDSMQKKKTDFWGITGQCQVENRFGSSYERSELPYHIQTYFVFVGNSLLHSIAFREFWKNLQPTDSFNKAVINFELVFTEYFTSRGFSSETYVDSKTFDTGRAENNYMTLLYSPYEMIAKYGCPILKRKCFTIEYDETLAVSIGEDLNRVLQYIGSQTSYDTGLILKNLIRLCNPGVLNNALHMQYALSEDLLQPGAVYPEGKKVAVIAHINYPELIEPCLSYLKNVPEKADLYINTKTKANAERIGSSLKAYGLERCHIQEIEDRGREISGLLAGCGKILMDYDYLCFVHDKRTSGNQGVARIGQSYMYMLWENMLKSESYILNVLNLMEQTPYLGVLAPPPPYHSTYFGYLGCEWTSCFEETRKLAGYLGLNCVMSREQPPVALTTTFWCRPRALRALFEHEWQYHDFPEEPMPVDGTLNHAIERIFSFAAQHEGYATGIIMNQRFASLQLSNYHYMLKGMMGIERKTVCGLTYRERMRMSFDSLKGFCKEWKDIYIYGTGDYATRMTYMMNRYSFEFQGYIVSDGHKSSDIYMGKPVKELSEIDCSETAGIIVALNRHNQSMVLPKLSEYDWKNLYLV